MRLAWLTDVHFNFCSAEQIKRLAEYGHPKIEEVLEV